MSLRYTGEATMDEPALRDVERWKDKIEVRLDNRQVFFLFFGSAMVACMLFVLGVIVGKRLETRGHAEAPAVDDPLAVLDRFGIAGAPVNQAPAALTFQRALSGGGSGDKARVGLLPATPAAMPDRAERAVRVERAAVKPTLTATAPAIPALSAEPIASPRPAVAARPASVPAVAAPAQATTTIPVAQSKRLAALPRPLAASSEKTKAGPLPLAKEPGQPAKLAVAGATKPAPAAANAEKGKGRFLLQLSSFQDKAEAEAFARRFGAQNAYVVATEIPGKGTWFRVRVGSYASLQEAASAKATFEHEHNVIAYVAGGGSAK
ncbi:MAG: SPOR domain-containing protein [Bacteroidota bacterium]